MRNNEVTDEVYERDKFIAFMKRNERADSTIAKYTSDVELYIKWSQESGTSNPFENEETAQKIALDYKECLRKQGSSPSSINVKMAAVNTYFKYKGFGLKMQYVRMQKRLFADENRELSLEEYRKLVNTARKLGDERLALIMETMASTGMRVSELQYITVESLKSNKIQVDLKNKVRVIFIPQRLCLKLYIYAANSGIEQGCIFRTNNGEFISRKQIWNDMKRMSRKAGIASTKVYPHNLRHVFARTYYKQCKDIARLADVLGHSSLETTRVYLMESGQECERQINSLGIVS